MTCRAVFFDEVSISKKTDGGMACKTTLGVFAACIVLIFLSGCSMLALNKELEYGDQTVVVQGKIEDFSPSNKPVIVLVYEIQDTDRKMVAYSIYYKQDTYFYVLPPGRYVIAAFEDANEDMMYQKDEYAGYYGAPDIIHVKPGADLALLDIRLTKPGKRILTEKPDLSSPALKADIKHYSPVIAEVVSLADERFSTEKGRMGLWEPVRFLKERYAGLYLYESYDAAKTQVMFVHGAGGTPRDWSYIAESLDRDRYQPAFFYYLAGLRLNMAVELMRRAVTESRLMLRDRPKDFVIISHSMGGLVSRGLVNLAVKELEKDGDASKLSLFISISSPWRGHESAPVGVEHSPAVIPSWIDMVPGSEYQEMLFETAWQGIVGNHMLFGYKGNANRTTGNNDGVVSLASQLYPAAQQAADRIYGFNEDHTGILKSESVAGTINSILDQHRAAHRGD